MNLPPAHGDRQAKNGRRKRRIVLSPLSLILIFTINALVLLVLAWPFLRSRLGLGTLLTQDGTVPIAESVVATASPLPDEVQLPADQPAQPARTPIPNEEIGVLILSMQVGLDTHLYAYRPVSAEGDTLSLTRLTDGSWDEITPALSPDGTQLAFSSNRDGGWQIYVWDLQNGEISRLTDHPGYKASPTWSPDGLWLAYERYFDNNLDIFLQPVDGSMQPMQVTGHQAADYAPAWSPQGRHIAFVSTRGGREQVWLADLDKSGEDRFTLLEHTGETRAAHPAWSPDGRFLAWAGVMEDGWRKLYRWDSTIPGQPIEELGSGDYPVWSRTGEMLYTTLETPRQTYLTAFTLDQPNLVWLPPVPLPGAVESLLWVDLPAAALLPEFPIPQPTALWNPNFNPDSGAIDGRWGLVDLQDVEAPFPQLHDRVDEAFIALRHILARQVGWDLLSTLENAYVPLTVPLPPGYQQDWLYTGRAFAVSALPINAGWMAVVREDYGQETYWRIYVRTRHQDGSQGVPLHDLPWDFAARYRAEPRAYEQGGAMALAVPTGYWLDLTQLAEAYGWERLPSFSNWRAVYSAARFNEFVRTDGLDWQTAMLELYPREILITPTTIPTNTPTPTPTATFTPTLTGQPSATPTLTETISPAPSGTPTP